MCQTNEEYLKAWRSRLVTQMRSDATVIKYLSVIRNLIKSTNNKSVLEINRDDIENFVSFKSSGELKKWATNSNHQIVVICFYDWMVETGKIETNPFPHMLKLSKPKHIHKAVKFIKNDYMTPLKKYMKTNLNEKDRLIISLLGTIGFRVSDLLNIKIEDIDFQSRAIKTIGKGDIEEWLYWRDSGRESETLSWKLKTYIENNGITSGYLFPSPKINGQHISIGYVEKLFDKIERDLNFEKFTPHVLRHVYATLALSNGVKPQFLQKQMRHSDIRTTMLYAYPVDEAVKNSIQQYAPTF